MSARKSTPKAPEVPIRTRLNRWLTKKAQFDRKMVEVSLLAAELNAERGPIMTETQIDLPYIQTGDLSSAARSIPQPSLAVPNGTYNEPPEVGRVPLLAPRANPRRRVSEMAAAQVAPQEGVVVVAPSTVIDNEPDPDVMVALAETGHVQMPIPDHKGQVDPVAAELRRDDVATPGFGPAAVGQRLNQAVSAGRASV